MKNAIWIVIVCAFVSSSPCFAACQSYEECLYIAKSDVNRWSGEWSAVAAIMYGQEIIISKLDELSKKLQEKEPSNEK